VVLDIHVPPVGALGRLSDDYAARARNAKPFPDCNVAPKRGGNCDCIVINDFAAPG
jgi:hypothetical protein